MATSQQQLSFAIRAVNEAKATLLDVQKDIAGVGDASEKASTRTEAAGALVRDNWKQAAAAGAALAAGTELLARSQRESSDAVERLAAQTGLSREEIRGMVTDVAAAGDNLAEMTNLMEVGAQQGLRAAAALKTYADFWDTVADATGGSSVELAKQGLALQAVGIDVENLQASEAAFSFVQTQTTAGIDGFLDLLQRKAPAIHQMGLTLEQVAAVLGVLESKGLSGKAAMTVFQSAIDGSDGSLSKMLAILGVSAAEFDEYSKRVDGSTGALGKLAAANNEHFTLTQRLKHALDEQIFAQSELVGTTASYATIAGGLGVVLPVVARGFQAAQTAAGSMNITLAATPIGLALLATSLVVGAVMWEKHTEAVERDREEQERHGKIAAIIAANNAAGLRETIASSEQKISALEAEREALDKNWESAQRNYSGNRTRAGITRDVNAAIDAERKSLAEVTAALNRATDSSKGLSSETQTLIRQLNSVTKESLAAGYAASIYSALTAGATEATNELFQAAVEDVKAKRRQSDELKLLIDSILKASDIQETYTDATAASAVASRLAGEADRDLARSQNEAEAAARKHTQALEEQERRSMSLARAAASLGDAINSQRKADIADLVRQGAPRANAEQAADAQANAARAARTAQIIEAIGLGKITFEEGDRAQKALVSGSPDPFLEQLKLAGLAEGGIVHARPGGTVVLAGEGEYDEAIVPLKPGMGVGTSPTSVTFDMRGAVVVGADEHSIAQWLSGAFNRLGIINGPILDSRIIR